MTAQLDRRCGCLRAAVNRDLEPPGARIDESLGDASSFLDGELDPFTGRAKGEQPIEAMTGKKRDSGSHRVEIEVASTVLSGVAAAASVPEIIV